MLLQVGVGGRCGELVSLNIVLAECGRQGKYRECLLDSGMGCCCAELGCGLTTCCARWHCLCLGVCGHCVDIAPLPTLVVFNQSPIIVGLLSLRYSEVATQRIRSCVPPMSGCRSFYLAPPPTSAQAWVETSVSTLLADDLLSYDSEKYDVHL